MSRTFESRRPQTQKSCQTVHFRSQSQPNGLKILSKNIFYHNPNFGTIFTGLHAAESAVGELFTSFFFDPLLHSIDFGRVLVEIILVYSAC